MANAVLEGVTTVGFSKEWTTTQSRESETSCVANTVNQPGTKRQDGSKTEAWAQEHYQRSDKSMFTRVVPKLDNCISNYAANKSTVCDLIPSRRVDHSKLLFGSK